VRIEMFAHGALCMAVSGKCYLSLHALNGMSFCTAGEHHLAIIADLRMTGFTHAIIMCMTVLAGCVGTGIGGSCRIRGSCRVGRGRRVCGGRAAFLYPGSGYLLHIVAY
ncbi:MAG: U32 family peptidase, partial [Ruminiclostridium sp.]|nr:U32 family peptidase [Ruminiclostridium sp.]